MMTGIFKMWSKKIFRWGRGGKSLVQLFPLTPAVPETPTRCWPQILIFEVDSQWAYCYDACNLTNLYYFSCKSKRKVWGVKVFFFFNFTIFAFVFKIIRWLKVWNKRERKKKLNYAFRIHNCKGSHFSNLCSFDFVSLKSMCWIPP